MNSLRRHRTAATVGVRALARLTALSTLLALSTLTAHAITVTEPPDQANAGLGTAYVLEKGTNTISGNVSTPSDAQDRFQVSVPEGMFLVAVSATTGGASLNGSVLFNNAAVNGLAAPLGFGTYPVFISTNFSPGTNWSFSFTVENPGVVIGVETFDYPDGPLAGQTGGTFWDYKNVSPSGRTGVKSNWENLTGSPAISGGRLHTGGSSLVKRKYNGNTETNGAVNDANVAKAVFYRVTCTTGATLPDFFGFASYDFGAQRLFLGKRSGGSTFGYEIAGGASASSAFAPPVNSTFTLVMRLDFATDGISLFLNPNLRLPFDHPSNVVPGVVVANAFYNGTNWSTAVGLTTGSGGVPIIWDNLVVATTWEALADPVVTTAVDEDNGFPGGGTGISLREAIKYSPTGPITFDPSLSGKTITLTHADGDMEISSSVTIDATALPGGLTVSGNNTSRHFDVLLGKPLTLRGLTLTGGNGTGAVTDNNFGGAISNKGTLTLTQCTLSHNSASSSGGAILNDGPLMLTHCTISGNSAGDGGGAILNPSSSLTLTHCTLSGNSASNSGGAIFTYTPGTVSLINSIVAGNAASNGPDITTVSGTITTTGVNLISDLSGSTLNAGPTVLVADPKLTPLGYFGGPVQTMHPLIGSPAIDAIVTTDPGGTDARGFPRFVNGDNLGGSQLDIGAVEAGRLLTVAIPGDAPNVNNLRGLIAAAPLFGPSLGKGTRIGFSPGISPITLTLGDLIPVAGNSLFFDASNIPGGVTISGGGNSRVFNIPATATVAMHSVKITGGNAGFMGSGAGIVNNGTCTMIASTLSGNTANGGGGGIGNSGTCLVHSSTVSGNSGDNYGAGIRNDGICTVISSTVSGNSGGNGIGGGIGNTGTCTVVASTVSGNSAGQGGGIGRLTGAVHLTSSIVAGNTAASDPNIRGTLTTNTNNLIAGDPLLAPLGDYGGPTQTMPPLPGSPALDQATATTVQTDQRGFPRSRDGDGLGGAQPDIGAVEASLGVTTTSDANPGSLRAALADAATQPGPDFIFFAPNLGPIVLASEIIITDTTGGVIVDASDRPTGIVIDGGPGANRHFHIASGTTAIFQRLKLTGGNGTGGETTDIGHGGSVRNEGTLTLRECTISACSSPTFGGALYNTGTGTVTLERSTLSGNTATAGGGAIQQVSPNLVTLTACTIANNAGGFEAGGINAPFGPASLIQCTVSGNAVTNFGSNGVGGVRGGDLTVRDCIISGNTDASANNIPDISPGFSAQGTNLIGGTPLLALLANYGGPTETMALRPNSPARNTATGTPATTADQRNFPIVAQRDIGAYEAGTNGNLATTLAEALPSTGPASGVTPEGDFDGDGAINQNEWVAGTILNNPTSFLRPSFVQSAGNLIISFPTVTGRTYLLQRSDDVSGTWINNGNATITGDGSVKQFLAPAPVNGVPKRFYRVQVSE